MLRLPFFRRSEPEGEPATPEDSATTEAVTDMQAVDALVEVLRRVKRNGGWANVSGLSKVAELAPELYRRFTDLKGSNRGRVALLLQDRATALSGGGLTPRDYTISGELMQLVGRLVGARGAIVPAMFPHLAAGWIGGAGYAPSYARIANVAESLVEEYGPTPEVEETLRPILARLEEPRAWGTATADERRIADRIRALIDPSGAAARAFPEPWQAPFKSPEWLPTLGHAATARSNAMSGKWAETARPLLAAAGVETFLERFGEAVDLVGRMPNLVDPVHADALRGFAWMAGLTGTPRAAYLLERLVRASAHKIEGYGARSQKGFSGAVGALERMGTFESLAALSNARNRIKAATLVAAVTTALNRAAERQALPLADLEELVVPTHGLDLSGALIEDLGDSLEARLAIVGTTDVDLRWFREGKELKAPPASAKDVAKGPKAAKKEIEASLTAQRSRIEGMMLSGRTLPYPQWRERYLDHPLLAHMVRRLVWRFAGPEGERLGIAPDGAPQDVEGRPLSGLDERATVRLWHPIHAGVSAIEMWRDALVAREIRQPFKQAYREIYLLTAAEERTDTYSNRFAAHILKQHQMAALARGRGWRYALQGFFDSDSNATLDLPAWGLWAEYFVQIVEMSGGQADGSESPSGIALYVATDQVRFNDVETGEPVPLATVPPVLFSEVLRDVDLFVGVASVGNDPNWADQGARAGYGGYWSQVSFGDLSATAETRKAVLERLLPRLAIGKAARIEGRYLVVRGKRRVYKIHLGSGNILMEPNDQYLCIVPGGKVGSNDRVYLPFEGDGVLAIILSKAAMLIDDDKITDPTILRQL